MANTEVYMDTNVFTDIVNSIGTSASDCVLSGDPLDKVNIWRDTDVGKKMEEILGKVYLATDEYKALSAMTLPTAYLKLRDNMINVDDALSKGIAVGE